MPNRFSSECGCRGSACGPSLPELYHGMTSAGAPLAMGYVPSQTWTKPFPPCRGLSLGTIFPDLCYPFCGKGGKCR